MQIPMTSLTKGGWKPTDPMDPRSVIGVYTSAHRRKARILYGSDDVESGPFVQVSRLGNPLVNEVLDPDGQEGLLERPAAAP